MAILGSTDRKEYQDILRQACENRTTDKIANRYPWQTRCCHRELLGLAERDRLNVRFCCGTGSEKFFNDEMITLLQRCADAKCKIEMVIWNSDTSQIAPGLLDLARKGAVTLVYSGTREMGEEIPHFLLVGDNAYRVEAPHPYFGPDQLFTDVSPEIPAKICFNDRQQIPELNRLFKDMMSHSKPVPTAEVV